MQVPTGIRSLGNMKLGKERCRRARFSTQQAQALLQPQYVSQGPPAPPLQHVRKLPVSCVSIPSDLLGLTITYVCVSKCICMCSWCVCVHGANACMRYCASVAPALKEGGRRRHQGHSQLQWDFEVNLKHMRCHQKKKKP